MESNATNAAVAVRIRVTDSTGDGALLLDGTAQWLYGAGVKDGDIANCTCRRRDRRYVRPYKRVLRNAYPPVGTCNMPKCSVSCVLALGTTDC